MGGAESAGTISNGPADLPDQQAASATDWRSKAIKAVPLFWSIAPASSAASDY
jgi:hypothetical protein